MRKEPRIDPDLVAQLEAAGVGINEALEGALRARLALAARDAEAARFAGLSDDEKARRWAEENAEAIAAHRRQIEQHGVFGEDLRTW